MVDDERADPPDVPEQGSSDTIARLAIVVAPDADDAIAWASLHRDGEIRAQCAEDDAARRTSLAETLKALPPSSNATPENRWAAFRGALATSGLHVVDLPPNDELQTSFTLDRATGRMVGETKTLHKFQPPPSDVARMVAERLANVPKMISQKAASDIEAALAKGDHVAAAKALVENGAVGFMGPAPEALVAARRIDLTHLDAELARELVNERIGLAGLQGDWSDATGSDAAWIRQNVWDDLSEEQRAGIDTLDANVADVAGRRETAFATWKAISERPNISATARAWALHNMSKALPVADPQAELLAQRASDAFLEGGDQHRAATMALRRARCMLARDPSRALSVIDEALVWFDAKSSLGARELRAGLLHAKADALLDIHRYADAAACATDAAELRRDLHSVERPRAASLHLAGLALTKLGRADEAKAREDEARQLEVAFGGPAEKLGDEVAKLALVYDEQRAKELLEETRQSGQKETEGMLRLLIGMHTADLVTKLKELELALQLLKERHARPDDMGIAHAAIAIALTDAGELDRALSFWKLVLENDPLHHVARQNTAAILWDLKRWRDAAAYFARERELFGEAPGRLYGEGRSLVEAGDPHRALPLLARCLQLCAEEDPVRPHAQKWLQSAIERGAVPIPPPAAPKTPITREQLADALKQFATMIAGEKRADFWRKGKDGAKQWAEKPERLAQNLLHAFLRGKLGPDAVVLEEIGAGAGRLDLLVVCDGGLRAILELKMLGAPGYSLAYALEGEEQILHYMTNREIRLGFLIVFDGRAAIGDGLPNAIRVDANTVTVVCVDVRPQWKTTDGDVR